LLLAQGHKLEVKDRLWVVRHKKSNRVMLIAVQKEIKMSYRASMCAWVMSAKWL
jgi:hypothetical protein